MSHHDGEDQSHDVDGVGGTKAGENGQAQVAAQRKGSFSSGDAVQEGAGAQGGLHLWLQRSQCHAASASPNKRRQEEVSKGRESSWGRFPSFKGLVVVLTTAALDLGS